MRRRIFHAGASPRDDIPFKITAPNQDIFILPHIASGEKGGGDVELLNSKKVTPIQDRRYFFSGYLFRLYGTLTNLLKN
ncbi:MAG: hypothetical protein GX424_11350 [Clostridiales bacterium]|jgi:hypothetical protein|nr:hypothetical protein [Clostridiales bacterium]